MKSEDELFDFDECRPNAGMVGLPANSGEQVPTMSSLDIAKLCEKDHANVLKDIRRILEEVEIDAVRFNGIYSDAYGRGKPCYHLPRFECDLVVSGYSVKYRAAIIRRWHELEKAPVVPVFVIPTTLPEALRLAADLSEKNDALALENAAMAPKADFYDTVVASDDLCQLATVTAVLGLPFGRNTLFQRLRNRGMLISGGDRHNLPKQKYIQQGLFTVKESAYLDDEKQPHVRFTTYATQKGMAWLKREFLPPDSGSMAVAH